MRDVTDHAGHPVTHGRATVNGVRLHYVTAGSGPPLVLLHGVPKSWYYWHRVIPLLSERFTVVAPDVRGFGDSARPDTGYDMGTIARDIGALMTELGHERFAIAGEDWGAAFAYAVAATYPERVTKLSFAEMLLPGFGLEDWSALTADNVFSDHFLWHVGFFHVRDFPEMLISGREEQFWSRNDTRPRKEARVPLHRRSPALPRRPAGHGARRAVRPGVHRGQPVVLGPAAGRACQPG